MSTATLIPAGTADGAGGADDADDQARRLHDIANARTAVEGATSILATDTLSPADRATLGRLLASGVDRLRTLIGNDSPDVAAAP